MTGADIAALFSWNSFIAFGLGAATMWLYHRIRGIRLDHQHPEEGSHKPRMRGIVLIWAVTIFAVGLIGVSTQETHNQTVQIAQQAKVFAAQVQECQRQFNAALSARADANDQDNNLAKWERNALHQWIYDIGHPPPEVAMLPRSDPRYSDWMLTITNDYLQNYDQAEANRTANIAARPKYPEVTCGKG